MQTINPAVAAAAALFTDGRVTDAILADVAAMERLPLYVPRVIAAPCPEEAAHAALAGAVARVARVRQEYVAARARLAFANKRQPHATAEARRKASRFARGEAMRALNRARAACNRAERAEAEARAALAAFAAPVALPLAA